MSDTVNGQSCKPMLLCHMLLMAVPCPANTRCKLSLLHSSQVARSCSPLNVTQTQADAGINIATSYNRCCQTTQHTLTHFHCLLLHVGAIGSIQLHSSVTTTQTKCASNALLNTSHGLPAYCTNPSRAIPWAVGCTNTARVVN